MEISYRQIRDLLPASEGTPHEPTDVREFFSVCQVSSPRHAGRPSVRDVCEREAAPALVVALRKILTVSAPRTRSTESIRLPVAPAPSRWRIASKAAPRIVAIDLTRPLPTVRANSLDVRALAPLAVSGVYGDLYRLPPPWSARAYRAGREALRVAVRASWRVVAAVVVSAGLLVFVLLFVKSDIEAGYDTLIASREASSLSAVYDSMGRAHSSFARAKLLFAPVALFSSVLPRQVSLAESAADGGYALTDALQRLVALADDFRRQGGDALFALPDDGQADDTGFSATAYLSQAEPELRDIHAELVRALDSYRAIGSTGDASLDATLSENIDRLASVESLLSKLLDNYDGLLAALGETKPMRYLVLNQNRDEIRAGGGFPGTLFFAELYQGRVRKFEKYDVYDIDWKVAPYREPPPPPLRELSSNFGLRDANYFIDFHETAKKVSFFFEKAGYESLDGVFAINQGIVEDFLREYGSVHLPSLDVDVTAENFSTLLSVVTEAKIQPYKQVGKDEFVSPKSFLFEFADELARRLAARGDFGGYARLVSDNAQRGEILFSSIANASLDRLAAALDLDGAWKRRDPAGDWIYPVFTSLSGNKSDRFVRREFTMSSEADPADPARCLHLVKLVTTHAYDAADDAAIRGLLASLSVPSDRWDELLKIQWNARNRAHVRFAVPAGATLTDATQPVTEDHYADLSTLSAIVQVAPGESQEFRMRYSVPARAGGSCAAPAFINQPGLRLR